MALVMGASGATLDIPDPNPRFPAQNLVLTTFLGSQERFVGVVPSVVFDESEDFMEALCTFMRDEGWTSVKVYCMTHTVLPDGQIIEVG